ERQLPLAWAEHGDAVDAMKLGDLGGKSHLLQVADRSSGQTVTARLVARKLGLVQNDDARAGLSSLPRGGRPRRSATGYDQVVSLRHTSRLADGISTPNPTQARAGRRAWRRPSMASEQVSTAGTSRVLPVRRPAIPIPGGKPAGK